MWRTAKGLLLLWTFCGDLWVKAKACCKWAPSLKVHCVRWKGKSLYSEGSVLRSSVTTRRFLSWLNICHQFRFATVNVPIEMSLKTPPTFHFPAPSPHTPNAHCTHVGRTWLRCPLITQRATFAHSVRNLHTTHTHRIDHCSVDIVWNRCVPNESVISQYVA